MTLIEEMPAAVAEHDHQLVQLHLQIAQRADQLAARHAGPRDRELDLQCWLEAEREVLGDCER